MGKAVQAAWDGSLLWGGGGGSHAGLAFDSAIRLYLESFRLPGEAQKINRIMESFGKHYHEQCPDLFRNADAVYILGYSVILLNTDQHNVGVSQSCNMSSVLTRTGTVAGAVERSQSIMPTICRPRVCRQLYSPDSWTDEADSGHNF